MEDVLFMEIHPHKFIQATGKRIRNNAFKRGNLTALKLLEMSQGDSETPDTSQVLNTHENSAKEHKEPCEENFLMSELDTESVVHENNQELGNMFTYQQEISSDAQR